MDSTDKPCVAVFTYRYLARTMTFVYRQLLGVRDRFDPIVLSTMYEGPELFPYDDVYVSPTNPIRRALANGVELLTGHVAGPSRRQLDEWADVARHRKVRLIHAHFGTAGLLALPLAKRLQVPLMVLFHGYDASKLLRFAAYRRSLRPLFEYAHIRAVSGYFVNRLVEHGADPARVGVLHCGVPVEDFTLLKRRPLREKVAAGEKITFLQVSSFSEKKGHAFTIEAFARYLPAYPNTELVLVGGGGLMKQAEEQVRRLGLVDAVRFEGWAEPERVGTFMQDADVFVHHSVTPEDGDQEGIPVSLMEAMATGLPALSTYHSGIPELVRDGLSGALVSERDIDAYAEKMREALTWECDKSARAREIVEEEFNSARIATQLGDTYAELIRS